jgi:outer membrane protein assembly factor BamB
VSFGTVLSGFAMTDDELLRLIQERSAEEWTPAELDALRQHWPHAPELRQAFAERLHLETQLATALANVEVTVDQILERARRTKSAARRKAILGLLGSLGLALVLVGIGVFFFRLHFAAPTAFDEPAGLASRTSDEHRSVVSDDAPADAWDVAATATIADAEVAVQSASAALPARIEAAPASEPESVGPQEPWTAGYAATAPVLNPLDSALRVSYADAGHDDFPEVEARRWWENAAGQAFNWGQEAVGGRRIARFQGVAKLRAPWRGDTLLRMTLVDSAAFELFFWRGREGVSLRYYTTREPHVWAAYRLKRDDLASFFGKRIALIATDNGAFFRSTPGLFDLQVHDGELILARGGIPLLTAPFGGLPDEVFLEGQCRFRGMTAHKSELIPLPDANPHPVVFGQIPAQWDWRPAEGTTPLVREPFADGSIRFTADSREQAGRAFAVLPRAGLQELIFRIDEADAGTAITFGDAHGEPRAQIAIFRDQKTEQLTFGLLTPGELREVSDHDVAQFPTPYFAPGEWIRVATGLGTLQVWTSGDRRHWGHLAASTNPPFEGNIGSIGVLVSAGPAQRSITLGHLEVRELSGLTARADPTMKEAVPTFAPEELRDFTLWMHRVVVAHPKGAETDRWIDTCAVATLQRGPQRELGLELLRRLLAGVGQSDATAVQAIAALYDAALLTDTWEVHSALPFAQALEEIGIQQLSHGEPAPSRAIRAAWLRMLMWTVTSAKSAFDRLAERELIGAVAAGDWKLASLLAQETRFWNVPSLPNAPLPESAQSLDRLARWASIVAAEQQPGVAASQSAMPIAWRHPVLQEVNKEGYNLRAELDSALVGKAYGDACRLVTTLNESLADGLLPDLRDRQLFVSMPTAILTAQREHPEFAAAMNRHYGETGLIRVRQAIADGHEDIIRAATIQFLGTAAAAEAHQWIGDRHLAAGEFSKAEAEYRFGLDTASNEQHRELLPRLRFAAALSGTQVDVSAELPDAEINVNGAKLNADEFAALVQESAARASSQPSRTTATARLATPIVPATYKLEPRATFDGHPGNNPGRAEFRFGDPFGKQMAVASDDRHMYLSNRFQINAYDLQTGQVQWTQGVGSEQGEAHDFPFLSMRPLIHGDHVFVRRLTRAGIELCCLKRSDGSVIWKQRPTTHVLTDPALWQGNVCAIIGGRTDDEQLQTEFGQFDLATGQLISTQPLVRFRDIWNQAIPCRWSVGERWAVCQIGPITACLTSNGGLRWVRRPTWLPGPVDNLATDFRAPDPILAGDRVLISVPGSRTVDGIDLATGQLAWRTPIPDVRGLRGVNRSRAVAEVDGGLVGLEIDSGHIAWQAHLGGVLEACSIDDDTILCARRGFALTPQHRPTLVWLDAATGKELAQSQLETAEKEEWQLGPIYQAGGKTWLLGGSGWKDHRRDLLELVTACPARPAPFTNVALKNWAPLIADAERSAFASIAPNWWPAAEYKSRWQFVPDDVRGECRLLVSRTGENQQPTYLVSRLQVPEESSALHFRVANQPGQKWRLVVRIDEETVLDRILQDASTQNNWQELTVDLAPFAGRSAFATAMHAPVDGQPSEALWKRIKIVRN